MSEQKMTGYPSIDKPWLKYYPTDVQVPSVNKNIFSFMVDENEKKIDHNAIQYFGKTMLFSSFCEKIDECIKSLNSLGVRKGDVVTIQALTMPQVVVLFYALGYIGAVANFLYISADEEEVIRNLENTGSKIYIVIDKVFSKMGSISEKFSDKKIIILGIADEADFLTKQIVTFGKKRKIFFSNVVLWNDFMSMKGEIPDVCDDFELPAAMVYTSGTTGKSKAVVLSHRSINSLVVQYMKTGIDFKVNEKFMNAIPIFVAYGLIFGVHVPLCLGLTDVLVLDPNPEKIGKTYLKYKPEYFVQGVAGVENIMLNANKKNTDMSFVKVLGVGGDAVPNVFVDRVNTFLKEHSSNIQLVIGYGMTEVAATVVSSTPLVNKFGTVGIPLPDTNVKIVGEVANEELGYGQTGEICFNAPTMMMGYFDNDKETNNLIKLHDDGKLWVHSGDLGSIDLEGFVTVQGRIKRMVGIWHDGVYHKVFPRLIETQMEKLDGIIGVTIVGKVKDATENELVAFVITDENQQWQELEKILIDYAKNNLEIWEQPAEYRCIEQFPRTEIGKVDYRKLEEMATLL